MPAKILFTNTTSESVREAREMTSGGRWRGNQPMPTFYEMHGKPLGIIEFRTIGKRVARIAASGFDMRIQYNDIVRLSVRFGWCRN